MLHFVYFAFTLLEFHTSRVPLLITYIMKTSRLNILTSGYIDKKGGASDHIER